MNIDSKKWQVRSNGDDFADLYCKAALTSRTVRIADLPSAERLAAMPEREFNRVCKEAFQNA